MLARLFVVLLLSAALVPLAAAAPDRTSGGVNKWVEAELTLTQPSLTRVLVSGEILVHKHPVGSRTYTATDMGRQYQGITSFDEGSGAVFVTNMESAVRTGLESILSQSFPTATRSITTVDVDEASLNAARVDAFDPPVRVAFAATVDRPREDVGLGTLSDAAVAAAFASGARVTSSITFAAEPGYDLTYVLSAPQAPAGLSFSQLSSAPVSPGGQSLTADVDNAAGTTLMRRVVTLHLADASVEAPGEESLSTVVDIQVGALARGVTEVPLAATVTTSLPAVSVKERFASSLPSSVLLDAVSADGLRALRAAGAVTDAQLADADDAFLDAIRDDLRKALGPSSTLAGGMDRADLAGAAVKPYDGAPPLLFRAQAEGAYPIAGENAGDADLALAIGGTVRFSLDLAPGDGPTTYRIHAPDNAEFVEPLGGTVTADGLTAEATVAEGAAPVTLSLGMRQRGAPVYDAADADLGILVDLKDVDVSIGKAIGGDLGNILVDVTVTGKLGVIEVPEEVKSALGDSVTLSYLSSDAVRLLVERGVLTQAKLDELEADLLGTVQSKLAGALGTDADVTGGFLADSLAATLVSTPATGDTPIVFEARTSFSRPLSGGSAAISLYSVPQSFSFPRVQGLDTTYTVVMPRGLAVGDIQTTGGEHATGDWTDGRSYFTVRPTEDEAQATVTMSVTPTFVLLKFWPAVLAVVVLLVLAVGTPIAVVMLRRRKA